MDQGLIQERIENNVVTVVLALLQNDLQEMMNYCIANQWKYEMINSNNLQLQIPKESVHLLFYLGHKILSGCNSLTAI